MYKLPNTIFSRYFRNFQKIPVRAKTYENSLKLGEHRKFHADTNVKTNMQLDNGLAMWAVWNLYAFDNFVLISPYPGNHIA